MIFVFFMSYFSNLYYSYRLKSSFENSIYAFSEEKHKWIFRILTIQLLIWIFGLIHFIYINENPKIEGNVNLLIPIFAILVMTDIGWNTFFFILFFKRLISLINLGKIDKENYDKNNIKYRGIITKLSILLFVTGISSIICYMFIIFLPILGSILIWNLFINSVCLIFSFKFLDKQYKTFCFCCRYCCGQKTHYSL